MKLDLETAELAQRQEIKREKEAAEAEISKLQKEVEKADADIAEL